VVVVGIEVNYSDFYGSRQAKQGSGAFLKKSAQKTSSGPSAVVMVGLRAASASLAMDKEGKEARFTTKTRRHEEESGEAGRAEHVLDILRRREKRRYRAVRWEAVRSR
jgi:hypothetical protein